MDRVIVPDFEILDRADGRGACLYTGNGAQRNKKNNI